MGISLLDSSVVTREVKIERGIRETGLVHTCDLRAELIDSCCSLSFISYL